MLLLNQLSLMSPLSCCTHQQRAIIRFEHGEIREESKRPFITAVKQKIYPVLPFEETAMYKTVDMMLGQRARYAYVYEHQNRK